MWRPTPSVRFDMLNTYDPNHGRLYSITNRFAIRAPGGFAMDVNTRYDPQQHTLRQQLNQVNTQLHTPLGRTWTVNSLLRYNGPSGKFDSINVQVVHEWDCLEGTLTYTENPFAYRNDREFFFTLRIKGLPFSRSFARGPAGETLGVGLGDIN